MFLSQTFEIKKKYIHTCVLTDEFICARSQNQMKGFSSYARHNLYRLCSAKKGYFSLLAQNDKIVTCYAGDFLKLRPCNVNARSPNQMKGLMGNEGIIWLLTINK